MNSMQDVNNVALSVENSDATDSHAHLSCPKCGAEKVVKSRAHGRDRFLMRLLPRRPYRCLRCYNRFWHHEAFTADKRRLRTWFVIGLVVFSWIAWQWLSSPFSSPRGVDSQVGSDPPGLVHIDDRTINGVGLDTNKIIRDSEEQRKFIEASGFQPPRSARVEIDQLAQAGVSRAQIRNKLNAAQVLAVADTSLVAKQAPQPSAEPTAAETSLARLQSAPVPISLGGPSLAQDEAKRDKLAADIRLMLDQWKIAWENGDSERYLEFYANEFQPASGIPRERWQQQRRERVVPSKRIQLGLRELDISLSEANDSALVVFQQDYRSANYTEVSRKEMRLNRIANQWYIQAEREI